jgi:hypothetical protein
MSVAAALRYMDNLNRAIERQRAASLRIVLATDFVRGGPPGFAHAFDVDGRRLGVIERRAVETLGAFRDRAQLEAASLSGAVHLVLGGLPDLGSANGFSSGLGSPPAYAIRPPSLRAHASQIEALRLIQSHRRVALCAGRRWGKSEILIMVAIADLLAGRFVGLFAPTYKLLSPTFAAIALALANLPGLNVNRAQGEIRIAGGGELDAWSLDHTGRSGRGRKYDRILIDEAAFDEDRLKDVFPSAILPSTIDRRGSIVEASTPNGLEGHFWEICNVRETGFVMHHAPTRANPHLPADEVDALEKTMRPEVAAQELWAQFVDLSGASIVPLANLLEKGDPVELEPGRYDYIGCAIDAGAGDRDGKEIGDATAAVIWALEMPRDLTGDWSAARLTILDWDIRSLALGHAAEWLAEVAATCNEWLKVLGPRIGFWGIAIEKPAMGLRLIEIAEEQGLGPREIDTAFMEAGKDRRALMIEPHVSKGRVKFSRYAFEKRQDYRRRHAQSCARADYGFQDVRQGGLATPGRLVRRVRVFGLDDAGRWARRTMARS